MATTINIECINAQFIVLVSNVKSATFAEITYESEDKIPQKIGLGKVTKVCRGSVQLNYTYENAVNNRIEKEGKEANFEAESLPWGKWFIPNLLIEHKGDFYLRYYAHKKSGFETKYFVDGRAATAAEIEVIKAYKAAKSSASKRQSDAGLDDNQVIARCVKVGNIIRLKTCSQTYERKTFDVAAEATH